MRMRRNAEGGFMEAVAAMMVVTVALSMFLGVLANADLREQRMPDIRTDYIEGLSVSDGIVVGDVSAEMEVQKDFAGFSCIRLRAHVAGETEVYERTAGAPTEGDVLCATGSMLLLDDMGRRVPVIYEVAVWL
ncbi:MAG: hypothetical protein GX137_03250 [Thermoplasmatales archaeon]|jgi:hypothetical protein|nr:hypothetical protein [Thermoplasmatales archaeon]